MPTYHPDSPLGKFLAYLDSVECQCNGEKQRGKPLCASCWEEIGSSDGMGWSNTQRKLLYAKDDEARLEAYENALEELKEK